MLEATRKYISSEKGIKKTDLLPVAALQPSHCVDDEAVHGDADGHDDDVVGEEEDVGCATEHFESTESVVVRVVLLLPPAAVDH